MVSRAKERLLHREPCCRELSKADFGVDKPAGGGRGWADALQGLYKVEHVRKELEDLRATIIQKEKDGKDRTECLQSYIFTGSPGTGKTTVAMALAQMLHGMGILGDSVKVVTGLDLQGSYTGQTKDRVNEAMAEAQGGVLFIDEAYTLGGGLVALMTLPEHLHRTVVVLAGYPEQMEQMLQSANPGLRSRFTGRMHFPDWDAADCVGRIAAQCEREDIDLAPAARTHLLAALEEIRTRPGWANARDSVTTYDLLYAARARRCAVAAEVVSTFTLGDAMIAMEQLRQQRPLFSPPRPPVAARAPALALALAPAAFLPPPALTRQTEVQAVEYWDAEREGNGATEQKENESEEEREHQAQEQEQSSDEDKVEVQATHMLRPQVHIVLGGMRNAVAAEEARLAELCRLQEEERAAVQARHEAHMARLRRIGNCVQGFSWHREGSGWRCAGGGHYCSDADLPAM
ncbi:P-loop containing nucleoside triphosphate hydrolase protein [Ochromonadaceae sp. CCMP2298]|nr:P-loop containing nucleoside triphosphate hydrolase protein [Ochromonadaceae sp. CCMP2298]